MSDGKKPPRHMPDVIPNSMMKQLTIKQLESARKKAIENAEELIEDAKLLYKNERWPRVLFLCQIAGEEIGKHILLASLTVQVIAGDDIDWKRAWKRLTSHHEKLEAVTYLEDVFLAQPFPAKISEYFSDLKKMTRELESFKQKSLYCDFTCEIPHCPSEVISKDFAEKALVWAEGRYSLFSTIENELSKVDVTDIISKEQILKVRQILGAENIFKENKG